jgi:hypothetical protein
MSTKYRYLNTRTLLKASVILFLASIFYNEIKMLIKPFINLNLNNEPDGEGSSMWNVC